MIDCSLFWNSFFIVERFHVFVLTKSFKKYIMRDKSLLQQRLKNYYNNNPFCPL
jgi:hypothetical protein